MKLSSILSLLLLSSALCVISVSAFESASQREVRSYTNELEYVDDASAAASSSSQHEEQPQFIQTESASVMSAPDANGNTFQMESESEFDEDERLGITTMLEIAMEDDNGGGINTEVMREMALEIHDAAQSLLGDADESFLEVDAEDALLGLSAEEIQQAEADAKADAADALAEHADEQEAAKEAKEAIAAVGPPAPAVAAPAAVPAPAPATTPIAAAPATPAAAAPVVIALPADMSLEHADTLQTSAAATYAIRGALGEVGAILQAKDDTISSLVANISYITINMGKLADQVDLQKAYISLLLKKLSVAQIKNAELANHVALSTATVASVRSQIQSMEGRLNTQDVLTKSLAQFLNAQEDGGVLPTAPVAPVVTGERTSMKSIRTKWAKKSAAEANARRIARAKAIEERQKAYAQRRAAAMNRNVQQRAALAVASKKTTVKKMQPVKIKAQAKAKSPLPKSKKAPKKFFKKIAAAKKKFAKKGELIKKARPTPVIVVEVPDSGLIEEEAMHMEAEAQVEAESADDVELIEEDSSSE